MRSTKQITITERMMVCGAREETFTHESDTNNGMYHSIRFNCVEYWYAVNSQFVELIGDDDEMPRAKCFSLFRRATERYWSTVTNSQIIAISPYLPFVVKLSVDSELIRKFHYSIYSITHRLLRRSGKMFCQLIQLQSVRECVWFTIATTQKSERWAHWLSLYGLG